MFPLGKRSSTLLSLVSERVYLRIGKGVDHYSIFKGLTCFTGTMSPDSFWECRMPATKASKPRLRPMLVIMRTSRMVQLKSSGLALPMISNMGLRRVRWSDHG